MTAPESDVPAPPSPEPDTPGDYTPIQPAAELSEEEPAPTGGLALPKVVTLEERRETLRGRIAGALLGILAFIVLASFLTIWFEWDDAGELDSVLTLIFAPIVGLVGAVTGFYYGEKVSSSRQ